MIRAALCIFLAFVTAVSPMAMLVADEPVLEAHVTAIAAVAEAPAPAPKRSAPEPLPVYVRVIDWRHYDHTDMVGIACAFHNIRCEPTTYASGAITIVLTDSFPAVHFGFPFGDGQILGVSSGDACEGRVWSVDDQWALTHELGHALGLPHDATEGNLMFPYRTGAGMTLTDAQRATIRQGAITMRQCA